MTINMLPVQISLTEEYPVIQGDEILFEDSSDNTIMLIQKGVAILHYYNYRIILIGMDLEQIFMILREDLLKTL